MIKLGAMLVVQPYLLPVGNKKFEISPGIRLKHGVEEG